MSKRKLEIELDADLMPKLKTKAGMQTKSPLEAVVEILREQRALVLLI